MCISFHRKYVFVLYRFWDIHRSDSNNPSILVYCRQDVVEIETTCRIPIWRTFGRIHGLSSQSHLPHCRVLPPSEFNVIILELRVTLQGAATGIGMSSQRHVSHCSVLPLGEFTVTIPEPHATLQGAVTRRNQCRDRATLQGVRIPSAILKIFFRHILFFF